jgi:hypothetical protein
VRQFEATPRAGPPDSSRVRNDAPSRNDEHEGAGRSRQRPRLELEVKDAADAMLAAKVRLSRRARLGLAEVVD